MTKGKVLSIFIGPERRQPMQSVETAQIVETHGIEGDRFFRKPEAPLKEDDRGREVTLFESEALEGLKREYDIDLPPDQIRRNIMTQGVALNHLVEKEFNIGEVRLKGIRLCEPCEHLEAMTQPKIVEGLLHRGGLRAQIVKGGQVHVGDNIST